MLLRNDVRAARLDENLAPRGYQTLLVWKLAERHYAPNAPEAESFLALLLGPRGRAMLWAQGFRPLVPARCRDFKAVPAALRNLAEPGVPGESILRKGIQRPMRDGKNRPKFMERHCGDDTEEVSRMFTKALWFGWMLILLGGIAMGLMGCPHPAATVSSSLAVEASHIPGGEPVPEPPAVKEPAMASSPSPLLEVEKSPADLHLFVPCSMILPFNALKKVFEKERGLKLQITYGNSVAMLHQIRRGQHPDLLITPGIAEMKLMEQEGFIDPKDVTTFGTFKLVLVVHKDSQALVRSVKDLARNQIQAVALANPAENSMGYYAKVALENLKLWPAVQNKLKQHWNNKAVADFVCSGRANAGIFFLGCPFDPAAAKAKQGTWRLVGEIPPTVYPKVRVQAGIFRDSPHRPLARRFSQFLVAPQTQQLLAEKGIPNFREGP